MEQAPITVDQLWTEAKSVEIASHPDAFLNLASRMKLPTGQASLQNLVVTNSESKRNPAWILTPSINNEPASLLASLATHAWRITGDGDEEEVTTRLQTVAEHCSRALLSNAFFWCRMHCDDERIKTRIDSAYARSYSETISRTDWTDFNLIRSPQIWTLGHRHSPIEETIVDYFSRYPFKKKGLPASLIGATALTWIDEAVGLLVNGNLKGAIAFAANAGQILGTADFYNGWDAAEEHYAEKLGVSDSSQAAKHLAQLSARSRQDVTARLIGAYREMGISKNLAAPILAEKFSLSSVTVRDKLKGV